MGGGLFTDDTNSILIIPYAFNYLHAVEGVKALLVNLKAGKQTIKVKSNIVLQPRLWLEINSAYDAINTFILLSQ